MRSKTKTMDSARISQTHKRGDRYLAVVSDLLSKEECEAISESSNKLDFQQVEYSSKLQRNDPVSMV